MAGSHLVMVSAFIEAEDAAKAISDPVKRQQMLDGLAKAWEFAKENPGAAGLEGTWAVIKGTVEDAWNVTSHTVESIAQNALGEDPLDAGLASSAALVAAIAFINPIRKGTKAAKALLKRAKKVGGNKLPDTISDGGRTWNKTAFNGRSVYKNDKAFDPSRVDSKDRTNIQRMKEGLAPMDKDGKSIELHHMTQREVNEFNGTRGAVAEVRKDFHSQNHNTIHIYKRGDPEYTSWRKNNPQAAKEFERFKKQYWKNRAGDF